MKRGIPWVGVYQVSVRVLFTAGSQSDIAAWRDSCILGESAGSEKGRDREHKEMRYQIRVVRIKGNFQNGTYVFFGNATGGHIRIGWEDEYVSFTYI